MEEKMKNKNEKEEKFKNINTRKFDLKKQQKMQKTKNLVEKEDSDVLVSLQYV